MYTICMYVRILHVYTYMYIDVRMYNHTVCICILATFEALQIGNEASQESPVTGPNTYIHKYSIVHTYTRGY